jgi:gliding motility-associated-like protein
VKKFFLSILLICIVTIVSAQGEANIWYFGQNAGVDFNSGVPVALTDGAMNQEEGCAVICDANGNLLFYTNGMTIWNRFHQAMPNGTDLLGHISSAQSSIIVPLPLYDSLFYVFTVDSEKNNLQNGFRYTVVDIRLDNQRGDVVVAEKNVLIAGPVTEKLTAVKHSNGTDVWIIVHAWESDKFLCFRLTPDGMFPDPVESETNSMVSGDYRNAIGLLKFSPQNTYLASTTNAIGELELFHFDPATGQVTDHLMLLPGDDVYGIEFSPDNTKLYTTIRANYQEGELLQYDLSAGNAQDIANSMTVIYHHSKRMYALQMGPDGLIYLSNLFHTHLGVINDPDEKGTACNYNNDGVFLDGRKCIVGLPNFIQTVQGFASPASCLGDTNAFTIYGVYGDFTVVWDFGDGSGSVQKYPEHLYGSPGSYEVNLTVTLADTILYFTRDVQVYDLPVVSLGPDLAVCEGQAVELHTEESYSAYLWPDGSTGSSYTAPGSGTYWVYATDVNGCGDHDTLVVGLLPNPEVDIGPDTSLCEGDLLELSVGQDYSGISWWNGSNGTSVTVTTGGSYYVVVTDPAGCSASDTVHIQSHLYPFVNLGDEIYICQDSTAILDAGEGNYSLEWWDGSTGRFHPVTDPGGYWVRATNSCGTTTSTVALITRDCSPEISFPNAFTPNGDEINDRFRPVVSSNEIFDFNMQIYSRIGQMIFETTEITSGWDGTFNGVEAETGTYIWLAGYARYYDGVHLTREEVRGYVYLLR